MMIGRRAIEAVLHVVFASPKHHDGLAGNFGHLCRFHDEVGLIATAKAAAHQGSVDDNFFRRQF